MFTRLAKRYLAQMGVGAIGAIAIMLIANPDDTLNMLELLALMVIVAVTSAPLLSYAGGLYIDGIDWVEPVLMILAGAGFFIFISVVVSSALVMGNSLPDILGTIAVAFVPFFVIPLLFVMYEHGTRKATTLG